MTNIVPFFVADRPMSLRLLKGLPLQAYPKARIGIMAHANTSSNFQKIFNEYPCDDFDNCSAIGGPCQYQEDTAQCPMRDHILAHTIKMCDSGIFTREGAMLDYEELFEAYKRMGVGYGIMIDVFLNPQETLASAKRALRLYRPYKKDFKLVGVAQGNSLEEYLNCYIQLKKMGYKYIAVGGLLGRRTNTVRFPYVRDEKFMFEILRELRRKYPSDWLFALGSFHPNRMEELSRLGVWADYKGWIFQYEKRDSTLNSQLATLTTNHLEHISLDGVVKQVAELRTLVAQRNERSEHIEALTQQLVDGRRTLRIDLKALSQELENSAPDLISRFKMLVTHGLMDKVEEKLVKEALDKLGKSQTEEGERVVGNISRNRIINEQIKNARVKIEHINSILREQITCFTSGNAQLPDDLVDFCITIVNVIKKTEQEHRFEQVTDTIAQRILTTLE